MLLCQKSFCEALSEDPPHKGTHPQIRPRNFDSMGEPHWLALQDILNCYPPILPAPNSILNFFPCFRGNNYPYVTISFEKFVKSVGFVESKEQRISNKVELFEILD